MDSQHNPLNRLLATLGSADHDLIRPHLRAVEYASGAELVIAGDILSDALFPNSGIISLVVRLTNGEAIEVAMIGRDSVFGASEALVGPTALTTAVVQSPGVCSVMPIARLREAAQQSPTLRTILERHEQAILVQAQQAFGCITAHPAAARLARWLLRARDAGESDTMQFTQEFLGEMLGVKRNAVSAVAADLQYKGLIRFSRGRISITDGTGLEAAACECYLTVKHEIDRLKQIPPG